MGEYGQIQIGFWNHPKVKPLADRPKMLFAYLLTCEHKNPLGCYRLPYAYAADDLRWSAEETIETVSILLRDGFLYLDEACDWLLVRDFLQHNPIMNPNHGKKVWGCFESVPKKFKYIDRLVYEIDKWGRYLPNGIETVLKRYRTGVEIQNLVPEPEPVPKPGYKSTSVDLSSAEPTPAGSNGQSPFQEIVDLYHEILPELPKVKVLTEKRRTWLKSRWNEDRERQDLGWWRDYFSQVRSQAHLMGENDRAWKADFEFLIKADKMARVLEVYYGGGNGSDYSPEEFETFWAAYPRQIGKGAALKEWQALGASRPGIEALLEVLESQSRSRQWRERNGEFIPSPARWLEERRWEDNPEPDSCQYSEKTRRNIQTAMEWLEESER